LAERDQALGKMDFVHGAGGCVTVLLLRQHVIEQGRA
jgi:hypothetical protein